MHAGDVSGDELACGDGGQVVEADVEMHSAMLTAACFGEGSVSGRTEGRGDLGGGGVKFALDG